MRSPARVGGALALALVVACRGADAPPAETPLHAYVDAPDPAYRWEVLAEPDEPVDGCRVVALELVSQTWRAPGEVDRDEWRHLLWVVVPPDADPDLAVLWIGGGRTDDGPDDGPGMLTRLAVLTGCVVAEVRGVPNQPLELLGDGVRRWEDDLVAASWVQALDTGDPTWSIRLPMVKSAVRAMDAVQEFLGSEGGAAPAEFVVTGASKRGWTTWLTAVVDERVRAIAPLVIDVLNVEASMLHHRAAYGFWAPAVGDYVHHGIEARMDEPAFDALMAFEDPYAHRSQLTLPKYVVNAAGDQFFLPDSSRFYWDGLVGGPNLRRTIPDTDHSLGGSDALLGLAAWTKRLATDTPLPTVTSHVDARDRLVIHCDEAPHRVRAFAALNPTARDFRIEEIGPAWEELPVETTSPTRWHVQLFTPEGGFRATFLELSFGDPEMPLVVTSGVEVRPDVLPFADG